MDMQQYITLLNEADSIGYALCSTFLVTNKQLYSLVYRSQTTVEKCIGGHVNVLSDYKKT